MLHTEDTLEALLAGQISPTDIIGHGFENPKSSASECIRIQIHNTKFPNDPISEVITAENGQAFSTVDGVYQSKRFKELSKGTYRLKNKGFDIAKFGIRRAVGGGFIGVVVYCARKSKAKRLWEIAECVSKSDYPDACQKLNMYYPNPTEGEKQFLNKLKGAMFHFNNGEWSYQVTDNVQRTAILNIT